MDIQALIARAQDLAQALSHQIGPEIYQFRSFQGFEVPQLNLEIFEERLIGQLKSLGRIPENTRIYVEPFDFSEEILGIVMYMVKKDRIDIHTASHLNKCKERLVVCKELCQIYLDKTEGYEPTESEPGLFRHIRRQIIDLVELHNETAAQFDRLDLLFSEYNQNEFLSFFMAVNLIFPFGHRADFQTLYERAMNNGNHLKLYDVAYAYRMPQFALKFFVKRMLPYYQDLH